MTPRRPNEATAPRHPIQVVARRTGLSAEVIRAWEKRHAVVAPMRSETGRRLYSEADIERLAHLAHATLSGRTIGQVAGLAPEALAELRRADAAAMPAMRPDARTGAVQTDSRSALDGPAAEHVAACLDAIERFDVAILDLALRRAAVALAAETFLDALAVPLWNAVLERVRDGALRSAHEHLAQAALRRALDRIVEATTSPLAAPDLLVTTPLGQTQEFDALLAAATASVAGWRAVYVGPGLSAETIAETAAALGAEAVALSFGVAARDRVIPRELRRLRSLMPRNVEILVQGTAVDAHQSVLREIDAVVLRDPAALRARLRAQIAPIRSA